jgi:hypothetical protein
MSPRTKLPAKRPVAVALCLMAVTFVVALLAAANAHAAYYKMVACSGNNGAPPYGTSTNTTSPQNPGGIFHLWNWCGGQGGDPPGESSYIRIQENQAAGNAGVGAYGNFYFDTPAYVHFKTAGGYTREPASFNAGWRARFWVASATATAQIMTQGAGLPNSGGQWATTSSFAPHLWPIPDLWDFNRFVFEVTCVNGGGCDRSGDNAADLNGLVFILSDDANSQAAFTGGEILSGAWVRGNQNVNFNVSDLGSGLRVERMRVDGSQRWGWDHWPECSGNISSSQVNGEWARTYVPCPTGGPYGRTVGLDTTTLADGAHTISVCTQDYGQYQGLYGTGSESCDQRTFYSDNTAPGAPGGLLITSANPNRYLDRFGAQFTLPPNQGSPITKVHYQVLNAAGEVVRPEQSVSATNPTGLVGIEGPAKAGDYRLRVWLEDQVGLTGPAAMMAIPHDTIPPSAPQGLAVAAPSAPRSAEGADLRWHNILDAGSPIDAAHYEVVDGTGKVVVPATTVRGDNVRAVNDINAPSGGGSYQLRLWLSDSEGNVGAPITAPLAYDCTRSSVPGAQEITAALDGRSELTVQQGQGTAMSGSLRGQGGPISTALVCVFSRVETDSALDFLGFALTDPSGVYRFPIPAGPSREVIAIHRPDQRQLRASAMLGTVVHPTLRARKAVVRTGESGYFEGEIPGPHNDNRTIVLQVKSGKGWLAFRRYKTRNDGHYELSYPFVRTARPTDYEMRAQVRETGGYPYLQGDSDPLILHVVPGGLKRAGDAKRVKGRRCAKKPKTASRPLKHCQKKKHRPRHGAGRASR